MAKTSKLEEGILGGAKNIVKDWFDGHIKETKRVTVQFMTLGPSMRSLSVFSLPRV